MPTKRPPRTTRADARSNDERLQKLLAAAGVASRRASEVLIREGRVSVNGRVVRELGTRAHPERDRIRVDGKLVGRRERPRYALVHKPRGVLTTTQDPEGRKTVLDLVRSRARLYPVGRLDAASEGLVLLTNDGALAERMLHPSYGVPRTYRVSVSGRLTADALRAIAGGVELDGMRTRPCDVKLLQSDETRSVLELTLTEGRRHQIRRMLEAVGHPVRRLIRTRFGPLELAGLPPGRWRPAAAREVALLREIAAGARARGSSRRKAAL